MEVDCMPFHFFKIRYLKIFELNLAIGMHISLGTVLGLEETKLLQIARLYIHTYSHASTGSIVHHTIPCAYSQNGWQDMYFSIFYPPDCDQSDSVN